MNREFSKIIKNWKDEAKVDGIILLGAGAPYSSTITINTDRPGAMIGRAGNTYYKYKEIIQRNLPATVSLAVLLTIVPRLSTVATH